MSGDMTVFEGCTPSELLLIDTLATALNDAGCDVMNATDVPPARGVHLLLRGEIVNLASSIAATRDSYGGDAQAALSVAIEMLRAATLTMLSQQGTT